MGANWGDLFNQISTARFPASSMDKSCIPGKLNPPIPHGQGWALSHTQHRGLLGTTLLLRDEKKHLSIINNNANYVFL